MTSKQIQYFIASVFFILGGWALIAPQSVIDITFLPQYRSGSAALPFVVGCFGAQAMISGLFAGFSKFTKLTFLLYAIALLPFFGFNIYFYFIKPFFTIFGLIDAIGNAIMLVLCIIGYQKAPFK